MQEVRQVVKQSGQKDRVSAIRSAAAVLVVACALTLGVGCGDKDEAEPTVQNGQGSLVPVAQDVAGDDSVANLSANDPRLGTSDQAGVLQTVAKEKATLQAVAASGGSGAKPEVSSPFHRPQVSVADGAFSLQLGSFRSAENARAQADRITGLGYAPVVEVATLAGHTYHRVVLHGLPDRDEAERLGEKIRSQLGVTYLIRRK